MLKLRVNKPYFFKLQSLFYYMRRAITFFHTTTLQKHRVHDIFVPGKPFGVGARETYTSVLLNHQLQPLLFINSSHDRSVQCKSIMERFCSFTIWNISSLGNVLIYFICGLFGHTVSSSVNITQNIVIIVEN